ncbi:hypothetical protein HYH02_002501 [Chlamydomonas schloesseri]|uniref:Uncharacterized protein n=1 Tax=Chlamydomonas schloesseri TaxID=2026947 RepID=A0A835WSJ7_9CHLO|nr:hypothetical protein HYH02_002501 [Chlamydomonas schloesseri]|eukprot:KAG2453177.1 hypothetical protein HYH02_002501 [Chlamydomonas schloesseri]
MAHKGSKDAESGGSGSMDLDLETGLQGGNVPELSSFPGDNLASKITAAAESAPVVIFGKEHCPFCIEVRRLFALLGVPTLDYNVDVMPNGGEVWDALKKMHAPQKTVPYVYVNKSMVGGCDDTKRLQADGQLDKMLSAAGVKVVAKAATDASARLARSGVLESGSAAGGALFNFPDVVDNRTARLNGCWGFTICLLCAIFYKRLGAHWVMGGFMVDFCLRIFGGSNACLVGSLSVIVTAIMDLAGSKPSFVAGPTKQFAAMCGLSLAALAFFFFLVSVYEEKLVNVGLAFTCALGACCGMEGAFNFCLGCWVFELLIKFGLVKDTVYQTYIETRVEAEYTWGEQNKRLNEPTPPSRVKHFSDAHPLVVDYKYKSKTEDHTKEDFHPIKHVKITHFVMHLGVVGLACAWKASDPIIGGLSTPAAVWYAIGIFSAIWYFVWVVLYLLKIVIFPRKVAKEIAHNVSGACFSLPWVILVLFAYLEVDRDPVFAKVLFWIGAPTALFLSIVWVGSWIALKKEIEHVNAAWMMMPVANFVSAAVGPLLDPAYRDAMQFWFAFAFIMWMALFVITLYKAFVMPDYDDRARPMLAAWVAAPAIGAIAYLSCYSPAAVVLASLGGSGFDDFIFVNMYWFSIALALVLSICFYRPYFARLRWDMSYWAAGFPSAAMSMCATQYYVLKPGNLSMAIAYTCLYVTSIIVALLLLQTTAALLRFQVFTPDHKWGPMSFMRLTHEALRGMLPRLLDLAKASATDANAMESLRAVWVGVKMAHHEHGKHEDNVIFVQYNEFFPHVTAEADAQHHELEAMSGKIDNLLAGAPSAAALTEAVEAYGSALEKHLRTEEDHLQGLPRKYIPLALAKELVRKCWAITPIDTWHTLLPLLLESMPMLQQRTRFLKTLLWSMPERCHLFGLIVCKGVDAVHWRRIAIELPELAPRGVDAIWERYY